MFTGIIEEVGRVESLEPRGGGGRLTVACQSVLEDARIGSSIAVDGVCLTAAEVRPGAFVADLAPETLRRSTLGDRAAGDEVNLERPVSASGRLDGHIVQGHVDAAAELVLLEELGDGNWWLTVAVPEDALPYLVLKGSVAIDGISLTVAALEGARLGVTIVPHTYRNTALRTRRPGARVNIECDIIAKYVARLLNRLDPPGRLTVDELREMGY